MVSKRGGKRRRRVYAYPDSLLLGGSGRVVGTQALWVIAVAALVTLKQLLLQGERWKK